VFFILRLLPLSPLCPYTTLFRSGRADIDAIGVLAANARFGHHKSHGYDSRSTAARAAAGVHTVDWSGLQRLDDLYPPLLGPALRSEEHTSELQSRENLVCRLLLE